MLRHFPKRIGLNVGDYDWRSPICRRPARAGTRSNRQLLHLLSPSFRKTRARHRIQMKAIGTKQQNRSKRAATVIFDNAAQGIQDLFQRNAGGDHFEKTLFTGKQRLPSLALGDVYRSPSITIDVPRLPYDRSAHTLDMLNRSVRQRDSKFQIKPPFLADGFIKTSLNKRSIFRMNCFQE